VSLRDLRDRLVSEAVRFPFLSRVTGRLADLRAPRFVLQPLLRAYVRIFGVDMSEAAEPLASFPTFNAFFTRRLREDRRPLPAEQGVLSPADARLATIGPVPADGRLEQVKGRTYAIEDLLGSAEDAAAFRGGVQATLYLSPSMYHRVHAPVDARVLSLRHLPGRLYPVNARAVRSVDRVFARNERVVVNLDAGPLGGAAVVLVGAANVGRISLPIAPLFTNTGEPGGLRPIEGEVRLRRGDELGAFNLGSTVVLLLAGPRLKAVAAAGELVRVRQLLFRIG
jgi:phosphatidylserine decarboxylase